LFPDFGNRSKELDNYFDFEVKLLITPQALNRIMPRTTKTTWDPRVDNNPKASGARIKFSKDFSSSLVQDAHRILDIGCGIGKFTYLVRGQNAVGIDLELEALKTANKFCTRSNFVVASALALPFRDGSFDLVLMWEIIEHVPVETEIEVLSEIYRISCLDSKLLLSTPYDHLISNLLDPAFIMYRHRHYHMDLLAKLINQAGFTIENCIIRGGWCTLIAANIFYFCKHVLHTKGGRIHKFFETRSDKEFQAEKNGFANIFLQAKRLNNKRF
jgi:2-polyprenyl-3-methyl-5-hydroxy-6-metoxy-1,4-benzoquinol methylase